MARTKTRVVQLPITTSVGVSGVDTVVPTEKAVRTAIGEIDFTTVFVDNEIPAGDKDGENDEFELDYDPDGTEEVFLNGMLMNPGATEDYTISGTTITMLVIPEATDVLLVNYHYTPA